MVGNFFDIAVWMLREGAGEGLSHCHLVKHEEWFWFYYLMKCPLSRPENAGDLRTSVGGPLSHCVRSLWRDWYIEGGFLKMPLQFISFLVPRPGSATKAGGKMHFRTVDPDQATKVAVG